MTDPEPHKAVTLEASFIGMPKRQRTRILNRLGLVFLGLMLLCGILLYPFPMHSRAWNAIFDLAHAPSFFIALLILVMLLDPALILRKSAYQPLLKVTSVRLLLLALGIAIIGAGCEIAQMAVGRTPGVSDALANAAGAISGCLVLFALRPVSAVRRMGLLVVAFALLLWPGWNPLLELQETYRCRQEFPLIASFERPREIQAWNSRTARLTTSGDWASHGSRSLRIQSVNPGKAANALMVWPPRDWTKFDCLTMTFRNPQAAEVRVSIHVGDQQHTETGFEPTDRFQRVFVIPPESEETIRVSSEDVCSGPESRSADLSQIVFLNVVIDKENDLIVFLDEVRVVNSTEK